MTSNPGSSSGENHGRPPNDEKILEYFEKKYKYKINKENIELIKLILSFYDILTKNMEKEEIIALIENIIKYRKSKYTIIKHY